MYKQRVLEDSDASPTVIAGKLQQPSLTDVTKGSGAAMSEDDCNDMHDEYLANYFKHDYQESRQPVPQAWLITTRSSRVSRSKFKSQSSAIGLPASSTQSNHATTKGSIMTNHYRCEACCTDFQWKNVMKAPCGHRYCRECIGFLFQASMADESLFPPRCCELKIHLNDARRLLKTVLIHDFREKSIELATVDRVYCSNKECSKFIAPKNIVADIATCKHCKHETCITCNGAHPQNGDCPKDTALQQLLTTAEDQGWKRCPKCRRFIELNRGCNHMT